MDGAIHKAAGIGLANECRELGGCKTGEAKITSGWLLPAKYVIHAVGPRYESGNPMMQLVQSIKERGIITPVTLRPKEDGRYEIVSAAKRLANLPGLKP